AGRSRPTRPHHHRREKLQTPGRPRGPHADPPTRGEKKPAGGKAEKAAGGGRAPRRAETASREEAGGAPPATPTGAEARAPAAAPRSSADAETSALRGPCLPHPPRRLQRRWPAGPVGQRGSGGGRGPQIAGG